MFRSTRLTEAKEMSFCSCERTRKKCTLMVMMTDDVMIRSYPSSVSFDYRNASQSSSVSMLVPSTTAEGVWFIGREEREKERRNERQTE